MPCSAPLDSHRVNSAHQVWAALMLMAGLALAACAPALNWRDVRGSQAGLVASFPCKPDHHVRKVTMEGLGGAALTMELRVCDAEGQTFAMTEVDVLDPSRVPVVLKNLHLAYAGNVGAAPASAVRQEWSVAGMTPQPDGGRWRFEGAMPSGQPVQGETGLVSRGTVIVQVNVSGAAVGSEAAKQFFESFAFQSR